jgi:hypothetical protein
MFAHAFLPLQQSFAEYTPRPEQRATVATLSIAVEYSSLMPVAALMVHAITCLIPTFAELASAKVGIKHGR